MVITSCFTLRNTTPELLTFAVYELFKAPADSGDFFPAHSPELHAHPALWILEKDG